MENASQYVIEMLYITKEFPGIKANDDITLQLKKGEIHALLGENGAGKSTLMSVLFGMYQPEEGEIRKNGTPVTIRDPNDATALGIGMVHQHFKLIDVFSVLDNIILGAAVQDISFQVRAGEIVCIAGIDGNGQSELIFGLTGLEKCSAGSINLCGEEISHSAIRKRLKHLSHIPEDRHKHGLVLDFTLEQNMVLQRFRETRFEKAGFLKKDAIREYANVLIEQYDVRSGQGPVTIARSMSGGNQQKAIIARELDRDKPLIIAVQPTRGLDVGAIEYIHKQLVAERDKGKAVLLVSLELDEVMSLSDRILVLYDGQIVGQLDPKQTNIQELGLYMSGAKQDEEGGDAI